MMRGFLLVRGATLDAPHCPIRSCPVPQYSTKLLPKPVLNRKKPLVLFFAPLLMRKSPVLIKLPTLQRQHQGRHYLEVCSSFRSRLFLFKGCWLVQSNSDRLEMTQMGSSQMDRPEILQIQLPCSPPDCKTSLKSPNLMHFIEFWYRYEMQDPRKTKKKCLVFAFLQ